MKKVILFSGLPGSGKSTISDYVFQFLDSIGKKVKNIDIDLYKKMTPESSSDSVDPPEVRWLYTKKAMVAGLGLLNSNSVDFLIFDEMFHLREIRNNIELFFSEKKISVIWFYVHTNNQVFLERNKFPRKNHILSPKESASVREAVKKVFEKFEKDDVIIIDNSSSKEMVFKKIRESLKDLGLY